MGTFECQILNKCYPERQGFIGLIGFFYEVETLLYNQKPQRVEILFMFHDIRRLHLDDPVTSPL